jgi:hypothetical protein
VTVNVSKDTCAASDDHTDLVCVYGISPADSWHIHSDFSSVPYSISVGCIISDWRDGLWRLAVPI